jgi:flagellar L-ring protein precursor FlgH
MTMNTIGRAIGNLLRLGALLALLSGCASMQPGPSGDYRASYPPVAQPPVATNGAIYQNGYGLALFEDIKARRIGDTITIVLQERTQASKDAKTETSKENDVTIANPTLLGSTPQFNAPGLLPLASNKENSLAAELHSDQEFKGEGTSSQGNSLTGNITVTVADVLPNGNLVVRGEKWLTLNQGDEYIQISGIVRPIDVRADNTVLSGQVADARITYSGKGMVADSNKMGWLSRFFASAIWPF